MLAWRISQISLSGRLTASIVVVTSPCGILWILMIASGMLIKATHPFMSHLDSMSYLASICQLSLRALLLLFFRLQEFLHEQMS
uniref:Uncharacterized protein n=1 Tax=Salix viminalis TaxID=40686 RepID=A0A6N2N0A6_SALVM